MEIVVKHFDELTTEELFEIYKLRVQVFVVEQNCPYQDVDNVDKVSYHVYLKDETGIKAYSRVIPAGNTFDEVAIGRVISIKRRCGLATKVLERAIEVAKEKFAAKVIMLEAQLYVRTLYEKLGFYQTSEEFLEDGIPHINMRLDL